MTLTKLLTIFLLWQLGIISLWFIDLYTTTFFVFFANPLAMLIFLLNCRNTRTPLLVPTTIIFLSLFIPFFAPIVLLATILSYRLLKLILGNQLQAHDFTEMEIENAVSNVQFEKSLLTSGPQPNEQNLFQTTKNVEPYLDTLNMGTSNLKKGVIRKLAQQSNKHSIYLLKKALDDPAYEIKFLASNAIRKIEDALNNQINDLNFELEENPMNPYIHINLGDCYYQFFELAILDEKNNLQMLERALFSYLTAMQFEPNNPLLLEKICLLYELTGNYQAAADTAIQGIELIDSQLETATLKSLFVTKKSSLLLIRSKAVFKQKNIEEVANNLEKLVDSFTKQNDLQEAVLYWQKIAGHDTKSLTANTNGNGLNDEFAAEDSESGFFITA